MLRKILFLTFMSLALHAQDSLNINLAEVRVAANINESELKNTARNVSIISAKEISLSPVKTLDGILQYALNLDVRSRSPLGVQSDISIRGGHFDQTLIMVDGIKMNDPQTGHFTLDLPVPLEMIDRIEVLQGGASRVFGPSAFSGVINIVTKKTTEKTTGIDITAGQYGLYKLGGSLGFSTSKTANFISISKLHSNGYSHNTAFDRLAAYAKTTFQGENGYLTIQGGLMDSEFGASNFYHPRFNDQYEETASKFLALTKQHNFSNQLSGTLNLSFRRHDDMFDFNKYLESNLAFVNFHQSAVWDAEWKMRYLSDFGATSFGLEWRQEGVISTRLGDDVAEPKTVKGFEDEGLVYSKSKVRQNVSAYLEQQKRWDNVLLSGGALINVNSQFGTEIYPGLDMSYFLSMKNTLYASANRSLRFPTFTEMYLNTSTVKADPNLLPEKAVNYEIGFKHFDGGTNFTASIFYRKTKDAIDKIKRPTVEVPTMENIDNINIGGLELSAQFDIARKTGKPNSVLQKIQFNYAYLLADRKEDGFQSFYTLNFLSHKAGVGTFFRLAEGLNASLNYTFKKREGEFQWDAASEIQSYKPIHLIDVRLSYTKGWFNAFVDLNNALDYKYFEFGFVEQPSRWFSSGIKLRF